MHNSHNTFFARNWADREHRLLRMGAESIDGPEIREQQDQLSKPQETVHRKLEQVTRTDDNKREKLYDDLWTRFMLEASVDMQGGRRVQWLPQRLIETAQDWHPAFKNAEEQFTAIKEQSPKEASRVIDSLKAQLKEWEEAQQDYFDAFNGDLGADLQVAIGAIVQKASAELDAGSGKTKAEFLAGTYEPEVSQVLSASETLRAMGNDEKIGDKIDQIKRELTFDPKLILEKYIQKQSQLVQKMDRILDRMRDAFAETDEMRADSIRALRKKLADARAASKPAAEIAAIEKELAFAELPKEDKIKALETEWKEGISITESDRKRFEVIINALSSKLSQQEQAEWETIRNSEHGRNRRLYLLKFGGYNAEWLVAQAEAEEGKYNPQILFTDLQILGFEPSLHELTLKSQNKVELVQYITQLTKTVNENGVDRVVRFAANSAGIDVYQMYLRSQFPPEVVDALQRPDLQHTGRELLLDVLELDPTKSLDENLPKIVELCTAEDAGETVINRNKFIQMVTFLLYSHEGAKEHELLNANEDDPSKHVSFAKDAEKIFTELVTTGVVTNVGDGRFIVQKGTLNAADEAINTGIDAEIADLRAKLAAGTLKKNLALAGSTKSIADSIPEFVALGDDEAITAPIIAQIITQLEGKKKQQPSAVDHLATTLKSVAALQWHPDSLAMVKAIKATGADKREFGTATRMFLDQAKVHTAEAAAVWWKYVRGLPSLVYDPELDPKIRDLLKKQDALAAARGSLVDASTAFSQVDRFFGRAKEQLRVDQEAMDQAISPLDIASDPRRHYEGAETLSNAALHLVEQLNAKHGWAERPLEIRKISFWLAMNKGREGLQLAEQFLQEAAGKERNEETRRVFIEEYIESLPEADRTALLAYLDKFDRVQELSKTDILAEAKNRDIHVKRDALMVLNAVGHAGNIGRWHIDDPNTPYIRESLTAIVYGEGGNPLIEAFISKTPQEYEFNGRKQVITVEDANLYVRQIQNDLIYKSQQEVAAEKQNKEYELFKDPIEKGLRGVAETLGEMWQGDMVDKAKVVAAVVAGLWLVRAAWRKGGWAKGALVGLPLLMVANTVYKRQTGKDLLGQHLTFMSKDERGTALERFRRRGAGIDKYDVLGTNAGHAALQQLTSRDNPIRVEDLLAWREQVKSKGYRDYSQGAPGNLNTMMIWQHMGSNSEMNDAYEVAFLAFEALCVDVAQLNGHSGDPESAAEHGADFIRKHYIDRTEYRPGDPTRDLDGRPITMLDVIINEARTPGSEDAITEDRAFIEWLADSIGQSTDYVYDKLKQGYTWAEIKAEEVGDALPEYVQDGKEWVLDSYDSVKTWLRTTYAKAAPEVIENYEATWKLLVESCQAAGVIIVQKAPGVFEFVFEKGKGVVMGTKENIVNIHEYILSQPELRMLIRPLEWFAYTSLGMEIAELTPEKAAEQAEVEFSALVGVFSSTEGMYMMRDVDQDRSVSERFPAQRNRHIVFVGADGSTEAISAADTEQLFRGTANNLSHDIFGKLFNDIAPAERRYVVEVMQANIFRAIAEDKNKEISDIVDSYESKKDELEKEIDFLAEVKKLRQAQAAHSAAEDQWIAYDLAHPAARATTAEKTESARLHQIAIKAEQDANAILASVNGKIGSFPGINLTTLATVNDVASLVRDKQAKQNDLEEKGLPTMYLNLRKILDPASIDAKVLTSGATPRQPVIMPSVHAQDRKLVFIPLNWAFGGAEHVAFDDQVQWWIEERLKYDPAFKEHEKTGGDPAVRAAYKRYLSQIALNEVFLRGLLQSGAGEEVLHPLHLSISEARSMDQYLVEKERLVSFKQFLDLWADLPPAQRP